jgi:energy-coupling factor transporter ATP-binding protein EcfA2
VVNDDVFANGGDFGLYTGCGCGAQGGDARLSRVAEEPDSEGCTNCGDRVVVGCDDGDTESEGFWIGAGVVDRGLDGVTVYYSTLCEFLILGHNLSDVSFTSQSSMSEELINKLIEAFKKNLDEKALSWGIPGLFIIIGAKKLFEDPSNLSRVWPWFVGALGAWLIVALTERLKTQIETFLDWGVGEAGRLSQKIWAAVTDRFQNKYYQRLIYECRNYEGRGFNAGGLRLDKVYVPLRLTEQSANIAGQDLLTRYDETIAQQKIGHLIKTLSCKDSACRYLLVLGAPGSGKSTLLRHITLMYALHRQRELGPRMPRLIPVLLRIRDVYQIILEHPDWLLVDLIENSIKELQKNDPLVVRPAWFGKRLSRGRCLVMLDGLDEIPEDQDRRKISKWVDDQLAHYPESKFILTSRPNAYKRTPLKKNIIESVVQPMSQKDRDLFVRNWCANWQKTQTTQKFDAGERENVERSALDLISQIEAIPSLRLMAMNPLLLVFMAKTYSAEGTLSRRRIDIYRDICKVLLEGRSRLAGSKLEEDRLSSGRKQSILQVLALTMTTDENLRFTLTNVATHLKVFSKATSILESQLARVPNNKMSAADFISRDEVGVRELISDRQQEAIYEFAHRTFQEYLTAVEIERLGKPNIMCEAFKKGDQALAWWREVILFYAAQADATPILRAALDTPTPAGISLSYECLEVTEDVDHSVKDLLEVSLENWLNSAILDNFMLSANVLLTKRMQRLNPDCQTEFELAPEERSEIYDNHPVTCAEYELFVRDSKIKQSEFRALSKPRSACQIRDLKTANWFCFWLMKKTEEKFAQQIYYWPAWNRDEFHLVRFKMPKKYYHLVCLFTAWKWEEADRETTKLILKIAGCNELKLTREEAIKFPCEDLKIIDSLWVNFSRGHFGFSVQKKIWEDCGSPADLDSSNWKKGSEQRDQSWRIFHQKVGWLKQTEFDYITEKVSFWNRFRQLFGWKAKKRKVERIDKRVIDPNNSQSGELPSFCKWSGQRVLLSREDL